MRPEGPGRVGVGWGRQRETGSEAEREPEGPGCFSAPLRPCLAGSLQEPPAGRTGDPGESFLADPVNPQICQQK